MNKTKLKQIIKEELQTVLKEDEASHASVIGLKIAESWEAQGKEAWQSLFKALDERSDGVKIAQQLQKISDDYLKIYTKQEDERYERREKEREERAAGRGSSSW